MNGVNGVPQHANNKKSRLPAQSLALALAVLTPFGMYWGLESGYSLLAWLFFGLMIAGMALAAWVG